jgi:hypothetical protein
MPTTFRSFWPAAKWLIAAAVLLFVGRQFARDLSNPELWTRPVHLDWLFAAGALYLVGLFMSACFWMVLLRRMRQAPHPLAEIRAYYLGHFGKYVPGKAWALVLRVGLAKAAGVNVRVGIMTTFYEVLVTMTAGALTAAALFAVQVDHWSGAIEPAAFARLLNLRESDEPPDARVLCIFSLGLAAVVGLPLAPPFFNRVVRRLSKSFRDSDAPLPSVPGMALVQGLVLASCGWFLHGASLWAVLCGLGDAPVSLTWDSWSRYTAALAMAYVFGFVAVFVPNGLGVREYFLTLVLAPQLSAMFGDERDARSVAVLATLVLRVVWMVAEAALAPILYWFPVRNVHKNEPGLVASTSGAPESNTHSSGPIGPDRQT